MANIRTVLNLTPDAVDAIESNAPSPNKKGEWASNAIVEYARIMAGVGELNGGDVGLLERIAGRLARMEKQIALLVTKEVGG